MVSGYQQKCQVLMVTLVSGKQLNNNGYAYNYRHNYLSVIPQYQYNILVITQVQGEAEDAGNN